MNTIEHNSIPLPLWFEDQSGKRYQASVYRNAYVSIKDDEYPYLLSVSSHDGLEIGKVITHLAKTFTVVENDI